MAQFDKVLAIDASFGKAYFARGNARMKLRQIPRAIEDFSRSIELGLQALGALNNRSVAYTQLGQYGRARADVEAIKSAGGTPNPKVVSFLERVGR